ncbi:hypothetical protein A5816_001690 [Enterococcus sp. 3G1_DIV0629]|nr:hypothetical protein A5816_001690 [Enterococcus sp. 3G1_DIV0629]
MSLDKLHPEAPQNLTAVYDAEKMTVTVTAGCPEGATSAKSYKDGQEYGSAEIVGDSVTSIFTKIAGGETHVYGLSALYDGVESETSVIEYTAPAGNVVTELVPSRDDIKVGVGARTRVRIDPEPEDAINADEVLDNLVAVPEDPIVVFSDSGTKGLFEVDGIVEGETTAVFTSGDLSISLPVLVT